jgi:hypothetical protein
MTLFQISSVLFALFMAYVTRVHHQKARLLPIEASFWYSLWFVFSVMAVFPQLLTGISQLFYFERVFDLLTVGAFMVLSFIGIRSYFLYKELCDRIEKLTRDKALQAALKKKSKSSKLTHQS